MDAPFTFGRIVTGKDFIGRDKEIDILTENFESGINTVIISPGRRGKSSLVLKASENARKKNPKIIFCYLDLFNVKDEEEFYQTYSRNVVLAASAKISEVMETVKRFLGKFALEISFGTDPLNEFTLTLDWKDVLKNPDDILDLPEKIFSRNKKKLVICIDEFQNTGSFNNPPAFQKRLKAQWQKHKSVSYCISGSKRQMMPEVFSNPSMPFYKFGNIIFLDKIETDDWKKFIVKRFNETGKNIDEEDALKIISLADCHSFYVPQIALQCWLRTEKNCSPGIVDDAIEDVLNQLEYLFRIQTASLTKSQIGFLKALVNEEKQFSSKDTINKYSLGTSANVLRIKSSLTEKEIIDISGLEVTLQDPMYEIWLRKYYFGI